MSLRELGYHLRGRINVGASRILNSIRGGAAPPPVSDPAAVSPDAAPLELVRLLEGQGNEEREARLEGFLRKSGLPFTRHPFRTAEGSGVNLAVDLGGGDRSIILCGHHDAVPGSPGANDNAAAVAILLKLARRLAADPPRNLRVRILFPGCEERCYLGARCYARECRLEGLLGVLSLELCGIGDQLAIWDVLPPFDRSPFLGAFAGALEGLGYRCDETYHLVGRVPIFGSDHRAFAVLGIPAFGLTLAPGSEAERLREFVFKPWKTALHQILKRPIPFHTYHTPRDTSGTLDPAALDRAGEALFALARAF